MKPQLNESFLCDLVCCVSLFAAVALAWIILAS